MEDKDLIVGTRVAKAFDRFNQYENDICKGEIIGIGKCPMTGKPKYAVKWDESWMNGLVPKESYAGDLMFEAEANALWSKLESEFKAVENHIKDKLQVAARAIAEASEIASGAKMDLSSMWEATRPLMNAMDEVGWRTSSLNC